MTWHKNNQQRYELRLRDEFDPASGERLPWVHTSPTVSQRKWGFEAELDLTANCIKEIYSIYAKTQ